MIRVVTDTTSIVAENITELKDKIGEIFQEDPNPEVMLTYVISRQPVSRRMAPTI